MQHKSDGDSVRFVASLGGIEEPPEDLRFEPEALFCSVVPFYTDSVPEEASVA